MAANTWVTKIPGRLGERVRFRKNAAIVPLILAVLVLHQLSSKVFGSSLLANLSDKTGLLPEFTPLPQMEHLGFTIKSVSTETCSSSLTGYSMSFHKLHVCIPPSCLNKLLQKIVSTAVPAATFSHLGPCGGYESHSYYFYVMAIPPKYEYIQFNNHYQEKYAEHNLTEDWILQSYSCCL